MSSPRPQPNWMILIVGGLLVLPLIVVLARGLGIDPRKVESPLLQEPAPTIELPRLSDGELVGLEELRGKPVVVNFWATWCATCPQEHPFLVQAARRFDGQVQFVGIAYQDKNEILRSWLSKHGGSSYPTLVDVGGKAAIAFGVTGVPETFVIDADGLIRYKHLGLVDAQGLLDQIDELL